MGGRPKAMDEKKAAMARSIHRDKQLTVKNICETLGIGKTTFCQHVDADYSRSTESSIFWTAKSYSPCMLMCCQATTEPA